jgi:serine/threonine-protein kinase RsbW
LTTDSGPADPHIAPAATDSHYTHRSESVELSVPLDPAYISVIRTVAASLAARRDFTVDEIDDLRIAVDEASALLLPHAVADAQLRAFFIDAPDALCVEVAVQVRPEDGHITDADIDQESFAWMVLAALTDSVSTALTSGCLSVRLSKAPGLRGQ